MEHFFIQSAFFSLFISLIAYQIGLYLKKRTGFALCNPLLIAVILVILLLSLLDIEYESYKKGTNILSMLLTPATICLAVPLYEQVHLLKKHSTAVLAGVISGAVGSMASVAILSFLFHLSHTHYVTLLPKSITTAIGMDISQEFGGIVTITVTVIIITGIIGNVIAQPLCKLFRIHHPIAKGIAIGSSSHAIGTVKAMEMGEIEGALSSLAIVVSGIITVFLFPIFNSFL